MSRLNAHDAISAQACVKSSENTTISILAVEYWYCGACPVEPTERSPRCSPHDCSIAFHK